MSRFWKGYLIAVTVAACLLAVGLSVFYNFIASYEEAQPEYAAQQYVRKLDSTNYSDLLEVSLPEELSAYETEDSVRKSYLNALRELSGTLGVRKNFRSYTSSSPVFNIMHGNTQIAEITLEQTNDGAFGMKRWNVARLTPTQDTWAPEKQTYTIYVPSGASLSLNGVKVPAEDAVETDIPYGFVSDYEPDASVSWTRYVTEGFYDAPTATGTLSGEVCPVECDGTAYTLRYPTKLTQTYTITAPEGAVVTVNGVNLAAGEITATNIPYEYHPSETNAEALPTAVTYTLSGLFGAPEVTASLQGVPLACTADGNAYTAGYPESFLYSCTVYVPLGSEVHLRETVLSRENAVQTAAFPHLVSFVSSMPEYDVYTLTGFYVSPAESVSVKQNGENIPLSVISDGYTVTCRAGYPAVEEPALSERAIAFTKDYITYTGQGYNNIDYNLNRALSYVIYGTDTYQRIANSRIGIWYVTPVTYNEYKRLETTSVIRYSDELYECTVAFDVEQHTYYIQSNYTGTFTLVFAKKNGVFMLADMFINSK